MGGLVCEKDDGIIKGDVDEEATDRKWRGLGIEDNLD